MAEQAEKRGQVVVISGPSGVGKSTICRRVAEELDDVYVSVSYTTRKKGQGEVEGRDYLFISKDEFEHRIKEGTFLEYAEVFGSIYGTPKGEVEEQLNNGKVVILEIDVQGGEQIKNKYPEAKMVFVFPPSARSLAERIKRRGREDIEEAEERLDLADDEIAAAWRFYEYMVVNDDLEMAVEEVKAIITSESEAR